MAHNNSDAGRPVLPMAERDRRWRLTRDLMTELGIEVLLVGGFRSRDHYEHYLSNDYVEGVVVFPLAGEPTAVSWTETRLYRAQESFDRGVDQWVKDYRTGLSGAGVAGLVRDCSATGRIGVVGLETMTAGEMSGFVPARFWLDLTAALPGRELVDISWQFNELMLPKSDAEIALVRYAADAAEVACEVMLAGSKPGVSEADIYADVLSELYRRGCSVRYPTLILHSGLDNLGWGPPRWTTTAEQPRRLQASDQVQAEIFPTYGNLEVQVQMSVAVGGSNPELDRCADVARSSYQAGLEALKPGITFVELVRAMEQPLKASGCWALTPLVHTVNPQSYIGMTWINREGAPSVPSLPPAPNASLPKMIGSDLVLKPGTTLAFEPNACIGRTRVNIGGTVVVTESGCLELNQVPNAMNRS